MSNQEHFFLQYVPAVFTSQTSTVMACKATHISQKGPKSFWVVPYFNNVINTLLIVVSHFSSQVNLLRYFGQEIISLMGRYLFMEWFEEHAINTFKYDLAKVRR